MTDTEAMERAVEENRRLFELVKSVMPGGKTVEIMKPAGLPSWLHEVPTRRCPHLGPVPEPVYLLMLDPLTIRCLHCAVAAVSEDNIRNPGLCDYCRKPTTWFIPITILLGVITYGGEACRDCVRTQWPEVAADNAAQEKLRG